MQLDDPPDQMFRIAVVIQPRTRPDTLRPEYIACKHVHNRNCGEALQNEMTMHATWVTLGADARKVAT